MKLFFDTEFSGLHRNTTLISIGIISMSNKTFYAEFTDYDNTQVDNWIRSNVIKNLSRDEDELKSFAETTIKGTKQEVGKCLNTWLNQFDQIEWVSDVCHYDFVLLVDLLYGNAMSIPHNISPVCIDINQYIADFYEINSIEAFNKNRENIVSEYKNLKAKKHNSMWDAIIIHAIYEKIRLNYYGGN
jgi:hypothetical protein